MRSILSLCCSADAAGVVDSTTEALTIEAGSGVIRFHSFREALHPTESRLFFSKSPLSYSMFKHCPLRCRTDGSRGRKWKRTKKTGERERETVFVVVIKAVTFEPALSEIGVQRRVRRTLDQSESRIDPRLRTEVGHFFFISQSHK